MEFNVKLEDLFINHLAEFGKSSIPELYRTIKKDSRFKNKAKETIRERKKILEKDNLLEVACEVDPEQGLPEKKYNLTHFGFIRYCENNKIGTKEFWKKLFEVGLVTNDYFYTTKKKRKVAEPIMIENQILDVPPKKRNIGFDTSRAVLDYEEIFLKVSHSSLYPKDIQGVLEAFENIVDFHKAFINSVKNMADVFENDPEIKAKQARLLINKNLKLFPELKNTYLKYKSEINKKLKFDKKQKLSKIYYFLKPYLQGMTFRRNQISFKELEHIQKLFNLKQNKKWNDDVIIESMYMILWELAEKTKLKETKLYKSFKNTLEMWQMRNILIEMRNKNLVFYTVSPRKGHSLGQLGLLLLFNDIVIRIHYFAKNDEEKIHQNDGKIFKISEKISKSRLEEENSAQKDYEKGYLRLVQTLTELNNKNKKNRQNEFQVIRNIIEFHHDLFPKIFDAWSVMTRFTNGKKLLDIFVQYYFTKDKYLLFSEERDLEIDLLNSQKAIESSYRFELEKFYHDGIDSLYHWKQKNNYQFQLLNEFITENERISLEVKKIFWDFDSAEKYDKKIFQIKENDGLKLQNFKSQINKIILKYYFPHPHSQQILSLTISHFIEDENQMNLHSFFDKVKNEFTDKKIKSTLNKIDQFTMDMQKIILIEKPLRELYLLDEILHSQGNPFRNVIEVRTDSIIQKQNDTALSDFISFQFFTSLHLRGKNIWAEVMKDNSLKEWYLKKLEEMTKIDELRLQRTRKHRNEIIQKLSS